MYGNYGNEISAMNLLCFAKVISFIIISLQILSACIYIGVNKPYTGLIWFMASCINIITFFILKEGV